MAPPSGSNATAAAAAAAAPAYPSTNGRVAGFEHESVSGHSSGNGNAQGRTQDVLKMNNGPPINPKHNKHCGEQPTLSQYSQCSSLSQESVASATSLLNSPSEKSNLTAEQRERMEENRRRALERKRQKQLQMQRAEENRLRALATKEARRRKRAAMDMTEDDSKRPNAESVLESADADDLKKLPPIQRTVDGVTLSEEQYQIVAMARPPDNNSQRRHLVRITAAAGTGKTTTLIRLALRCIELGHDHLTYVTFSKASADDAKRRIEAALLASSDFGSQQRQPIIHASTLHSCAQQLNNEARGAEADISGGKLLDEEDFKQLVLNVCGEEIERYLAPADRHIEAGGGGGDTVTSDGKSGTPSAEIIASRKRRARQQVVYFIYKTFTNNLAHNKRSFEDFQNKSNEWRHFFPVKKGWHSAGEKGEKEFGFPSHHYADLAVFQFYADMACRVWEFVESQDLRSHDIEMKRAQLNKRQIRGSVLLVDESQDLDGAQIDWVQNQAEMYRTQVYFVGDAAQTIFSFRGAQSRHLMSLKATDLSLTTSFRFGPDIARIANTVLFAKENSSNTPASNGAKATWKPYRINALANKEDVVTDESILPLWREKQITLIGFSNGGLMMAAMAAMGMGSLLEADENDDDGEGGEDDKGRCDKNAKDDNILTSDRLPKICINGKGENSGIRKWRQTIKQIETLHHLYSAGVEGMQLPDNFREFENQRITWDAFKKDVEAREMTKYKSCIQVIDAYGNRTNEAVAFFQEEVIMKRYTDNEADIVLTTCHSAKGMEWDNCQVLDEFIGLYSFTDRDNDKKTLDHSTFEGPHSSMSQDFSPEAKRKGKTRNRWQFDVPPYGDSVNLLYVACTRAKKMLSIPAKLRKLYAELDSLTSRVNSWQETFNNGGEDLSLSIEDEDIQYVDVKKDNRNLNKKETCQLYYDLCIELRIEGGLKEGEEFNGTVYVGLGLEDNGEDVGS